MSNLEQVKKCSYSEKEGYPNTLTGEDKSIIKEVDRAIDVEKKLTLHNVVIVYHVHNK